MGPLEREIQSTVTAADSCDGEISVLNHRLLWSNFVNALLSHSSQWFKIHKTSQPVSYRTSDSFRNGASNCRHWWWFPERRTIRCWTLVDRRTGRLHPPLLWLLQCTPVRRYVVELGRTAECPTESPHRVPVDCWLPTAQVGRSDAGFDSCWTQGWPWCPHNEYRQPAVLTHATYDSSPLLLPKDGSSLTVCIWMLIWTFWHIRIGFKYMHINSM